ncbi:MAG: hypothetical protein HN333_01170, partial [Rhodospirillaceae bacterium]|nr:hypothetical protein [Rhodospirillaceae bacterium]
AMDVDAAGIIISGAPALAKQLESAPRRIGKAVLETIMQNLQARRGRFLIAIEDNIVG